MEFSFRGVSVFYVAFFLTILVKIENLAGTKALRINRNVVDGAFGGELAISALIGICSYAEIFCAFLGGVEISGCENGISKRIKPKHHIADHFGLNGIGGGSLPIQMAVHVHVAKARFDVFQNDPRAGAPLVNRIIVFGGRLRCGGHPEGIGCDDPIFVLEVVNAGGKIALICPLLV